MSYVAPSYEALHLATSGLQEAFNGFSRRYIPPKYELLSKKCENLEETYCEHVRNKPNRFFGLTPDPTRLEEIACITRLMSSFPATDPDTAERHQVHNTLLGALFYRRLSIEFSCSGMLGSVLAYAGSSVDSSALYKAIEEILGIHAMNKLDDLTIVTCCKAYLQHLRTINAKVGSIFINKQDANFFTQLETQIREAEQRSRPMERQMRHFVAIQSIGSMLCKTDAETCTGLDTFAQALSIKLKTEETMSREAMIACLSATALSPRVQEMICYLLPDDMVLTKESWKTFVRTVKDRLVVNSKYVLLGAYTVVLDEPGADDSAFKKTLNSAIGVHHSSNVLDSENRELMLAALASYLRLPGIRDFDFNAWDGFGLLQAQVKQHMEDLCRTAAMAQSISASMLS